MPVTVFVGGPPIIAALHLPDLALSRHRMMAWLEDYALAEALAVNDGVIVSAALMRRDAAEDDLVRWDADRCQRFMDAARVA